MNMHFGRKALLLRHDQTNILHPLVNPFRGKISLLHRYYPKCFSPSNLTCP